MGLSPAVAMPVMMLDAAMIMTASTPQFVKNNRVSWNGYAVMVLGGIVGVLIAVTFLSNLNSRINKADTIKRYKGRPTLIDFPKK